MPFLIELIKRGETCDDADVAIVGIPFDKGVVLEGGRPGSSMAPENIRAELSKYHKAYNLKNDVDLRNLKIVDMGDIPLKGMDSWQAHKKIQAEMEKIFDKYPVVIVLGGGHDISYSTIKALSTRGPIGGLNLDAHMDVKDRDDLGSGTPFGNLLREEILGGKNFIEMGMHDNFATKDDVDFLRSKGCKIIPLSSVNKKGVDKSIKSTFKYIGARKSLFLSVDIDVVAEAFAPGCSAPSADGFSPQKIIRASYLAGKQKGLKLFEIMEVNPKHDTDNRTSRLAATMIAAFLTGLAKIKSN